MVYVVCHASVLSSFFFFKQKTAYEMRISDWSSDVCSSDLITKEIWHLACASRAFHAGEPTAGGSQDVYHKLLETIADECGIQLRVLVDILAGASAGGINAIFLADARSEERRGGKGCVSTCRSRVSQ